MSEQRSDSAESWALPEDAQPPLLGELVERIDAAMAAARSAEAAAVTIGAAALDAADEARRVAERVERTSVPPDAGAPQTGAPREDGLDAFSAHADRVAARLSRLQHPPVAEPAVA